MRSERFTRQTGGFHEEGMRYTAEAEEERWTLERAGLGVYPTTEPMVFEQFILGPAPALREEKAR